MLRRSGLGPTEAFLSISFITVDGPVQLLSGVMTHNASTWNRWDVHLHAPGTALADEFGDDWAGFFAAIEQATPSVVALGITDYWSLSTYKAFLVNRADRAPGVELVFPNVELRLTPKTSKGHAINLHLLISPDDPDHVAQAERALRSLCARFKHDVFECDRDGLIRLGRQHREDPSLSADKAYREGVEQFKIDAMEIIGWYTDHPWLRTHALLAIAGGNDGLAGLRRDSSFKQYHDELVRASHLVFSATPSDRAFFLGKGPATLDEITALYGGPKACLHGSDAHSVATTLKPAGDRYCWIKAAPTFDGLRQVLYEPSRRVAIGTSRPESNDPAQTIVSLSISGDRGWFATNSVTLSPYLTAIIGEKGTGKTALADLIAAGTGSWDGDEGSFLSKALSELSGARVEIRWADGTTASRDLNEVDAVGTGRVRYLSQQFVERLCSHDALALELVQEVERVVFDHLPEEDRLNCASFSELCRKRTSSLQASRADLQHRIGDLSHRIEQAVADVLSVPAKLKLHADKEREREQTKKQLDELVSSKDQTTAQKVDSLRDELSKLETEAANAKERVQKLEELAAKVARDQLRFDDDHQDLRPLLREAGVDEGCWPRYKAAYVGDVNEPIERAREAVGARLKALQGESDVAEPSIPSLKAKVTAEQKKLHLDARRRRRVAQLQTAESRLKSEIGALAKDIERIAELKRNGLPQIQARRMEAYLEYFRLLHEERQIRAELYAPLESELGGRQSGERDLSFEVRTTVDVATWAALGEDMLDLRRSGPYAQRGALEDAATDLLKEAWETGDQNQIRTGIEAIYDGIREGGLSSKLRSGYAPKHIAEWMFSVDHITLDYSLKYRGTSLRYLSPGTRGIVLLILYLAIDQIDNRPLIIDQPEENLDNASVFEVLVRYFREAKERRQIIVVTHNPNLVVNTDAEEVIIATADRRDSGLPVISYQIGPLEAIPSAGKPVRDHVCEILEGGKEAFLSRERRYDLPAKAH